MTTRKHADAYVVRVGDAQVGPVSLDQLKRGLLVGKIPASAEAKTVDGDDWKPIAEVAMRTVLPMPRLPRKYIRAEPSWSAFQDGEVVSPIDAPPLPLADGLSAPTKTFSRPMYLVFVPGSSEPPAGPYSASALRKKMESGDAPHDAMVILVSEDARWLPIGNVMKK